jgi:hypothetical protein
LTGGRSCRGQPQKDRGRLAVSDSFHLVRAERCTRRATLGPVGELTAWVVARDRFNGRTSGGHGQGRPGFDGVGASSRRCYDAGRYRSRRSGVLRPLLRATAQERLGRTLLRHAVCAQGGDGGRGHADRRAHRGCQPGGCHRLLQGAGGWYAVPSFDAWGVCRALRPRERQRERERRWVWAWRTRCEW